MVLDGLHLDRVEFERLAAWASRNDLQSQDAIQLAICAFNDRSRSTAWTPMTIREARFSPEADTPKR